MSRLKSGIWSLAAASGIFLAGSVTCVVLRLILPAAVLAIAAGAGMFFLVRLCRRYLTARLIVENEIIGISPAQITTLRDGRENAPGKVVVSPFGILIGSRPYKFNCDNVKLISVEFTREAVLLRFGAEDETYDLRLLHGLSERPEVESIAKKIKYETGVTPAIAGW